MAGSVDPWEACQALVVLACWEGAEIRGSYGPLNFVGSGGDAVGHEWKIGVGHAVLNSGVGASRCSPIPKRSLSASGRVRPPPLPKVPLALASGW